MRRVHSDSNLVLLSKPQIYLLEKSQKNCSFQAQVIQDQKESIEKNKKQILISKFKILVEKYYLNKKIKDLENTNKKLNIQISLFENNIDQIDDNEILTLENNFICSITLSPFRSSGCC